MCKREFWVLVIQEGDYSFKDCVHVAWGEAMNRVLQSEEWCAKHWKGGLSYGVAHRTQGVGHEIIAMNQEAITQLRDEEGND